MRVIIQNDKSRLFARIDNAISARSRLSGESLLGATSINLINATDFLANDYVLVDNIDSERAEITQITTLSSNTLNLTAATKFPHDDKTTVSKLDYNKIRFYEDDTVLSDVNMQPDYFTSLLKVVDDSKTYSVSFLNSQTSKESPRGEKIYGNEYLLCGIGDISQLESMDIIGGKIIDKIEIATRVIRVKLTNQKQVFGDLLNPEVFRLPCALLALHYFFFELIKGEKDIPTIKSAGYLEKFDAEMARATNLINSTETKVKVFGQAQALR